jgi:hypothetical protein
MQAFQAGGWLKSRLSGGVRGRRALRTSSVIALSAALLILVTSASALAGDGREAGPNAPPANRGDQANRKQRELVFLDAEVGTAYVDVLALKYGELVDPARAKSRGFGFTYGAALGVRLHEFTFAARYRQGDFSDWQLWTLGGEARMNFTLGRVAPHFGIGAGYASLDGTVADTSRAFTANAAPAIDISGLNLRVHLGADYYVSSWFSIGANLGGEAFFLHRKGDRLLRSSPTDPNSPVPFLYGQDGSGNGLGVTLSGVLGLHY